ncbi:DUF6475 domain-containing protein [Uliginosibacterium sediminicola]|uniref:DUF6475 domain-containing protein n=1 Tax=Uliginosibacterium sediminicola TaxID=2024550 RepID=A0ABU9YW61_9RHOO
MLTEDFDAFRDLIAGVHAFYRRELSSFGLSVWWNAMRAYDLAAVSDAVGRHCVNPDTGQFMPMPADVVKMLSGRTVDAALLAWSKVDRAIRHVGGNQSVAFDDGLIHRVLLDMGGWAPMRMKSEEELVFVGKEFVNRYRGYAMRSERPAYPAYLPGVYEAENTRRGMKTDPPRMIGAPDQVAAVMLAGGNCPAIRVTPAAPELMAMLDKPTRESETELIGGGA